MYDVADYSNNSAFDGKRLSFLCCPEAAGAQGGLTPDGAALGGDPGAALLCWRQ